jgi:hypothetical protein
MFNTGFVGLVIAFCLYGVELMVALMEERRQKARPESQCASIAELIDRLRNFPRHIGDV